MPTSKAKTSPKKSKTYSLEEFLKLSKKGHVWEIGESRFRIQRKGTFKRTVKGEVAEGKDYDLDFFQKELVLPNLLKTGNFTKKDYLKKYKNNEFAFVGSEQITMAFPGKRSPSAYNLFVQEQTKKRYNTFEFEGTKKEKSREWRRQLGQRWKSMTNFDKGKYEAAAAKKKQPQCEEGFVLTKVSVPKGIRKNVTKRKTNETKEEKEARAKQNRIWKKRLMNEKKRMYVLDDQGKPIKQTLKPTKKGEKPKKITDNPFFGTSGE